jgi:hypothetical protein
MFAGSRLRYRDLFYNKITHKIYFKSTMLLIIMVTVYGHFFKLKFGTDFLFSPTQVIESEMCVCVCVCVCDVF